MDAKTIGLIVGALLVGIVLGYFAGGSTGGQTAQLQNQIASLQSQISTLQQNITATMTELNRLRAIHVYSVGSTITTFSGADEDKASAPFHFNGGNLKITISLQVTSVYGGSIYVYLKKVGGTIAWYGSTHSEGTFESYAYDLSSGDYYLDVTSMDFNWQITVQVYA